MTARTALEAAGFTGPDLDIALAVGYAESGGYLDAVGDWTQLADPTVAAKWGPSVGWFQVRTLRNPGGWGAADTVRDIGTLAGRPAGTEQAPGQAVAEQAALAQGRAAATIMRGRDWTLWSVFRSGAHRPYVGMDYPLLLGHAEAGRWNLAGKPASS